jgi:diadenosine tetraphosphate (Ap4A) HIT family hydrolase
LRCPFCEAIEEEMLVLSEDVVFAIVDRQPINRGHVLVVPREHFEELTELPEEVGAAVMSALQRVSTAVKRVVKPDAVTHISDDDLAGSGINQVAHFKFHVIPRFRGEAAAVDWHRPPPPDRSVLAGLATQVREAMP